MKSKPQKQKVTEPTGSMVNDLASEFAHDDIIRAMYIVEQVMEVTDIDEFLGKTYAVAQILSTWG